MKKINSVRDLHEAIERLESDQKYQGKLLKNHFTQTAESLKPMNLVKAAIKDLLSSPTGLIVGVNAIKSFGHTIIDRFFKSKPADAGPEEV